MTKTYRLYTSDEINAALAAGCAAADVAARAASAMLLDEEAREAGYRIFALSGVIINETVQRELRLEEGKDGKRSS